MASIKSVYLTYIFDIDVVYQYIQVYPASYKYILCFITFNESDVLDYMDSRGTLQLKPYTIYTILIENRKIKTALPTWEHQFSLQIPMTNPEIGYATIDFHHKNKKYEIVQCNVFDKNTLYTLFIIERPEDLVNVEILSDDVNFRNAIVKSSNPSITNTKTYTAVLLVHERLQMQQQQKIPSRYMIKYIFDKEQDIYLTNGVDENIIFIDNSLMGPTPQIIDELLKKYVPEFTVSSNDFDLSFLFDAIN